MTALLLSGFLSTASAFKVAQPENIQYSSPNGKYTLKIFAESGVHRLFEGKKELWSFEQEVWHDDYFVSNDGQYVLRVAWKHVKDKAADKGEAVVVYSAEGKVMSKTYAEASKPRPKGNREIGPVGDFWRIWRTGVKRDGEKVTIEVTGKDPLVISLANPAGGD